MKAAVYYGVNDIRTEDRDLPELEAGEALIKMYACGLCGTDIHKAVHKTVKPGTVLGHEVGGEIVKLGEGVGNFRIGDRVFVAHHVPCFTCHACQRGHHTVCKQWKETNIEPGGFSEYIRLSPLHVKHSMVKLPDSVTYEQAAMMEPTACALRAVERAGIRPGDSVMVVGTGQVGAILLQLSKAWHAGLVIANDVSEYRLAMAQKLGADRIINGAKEDMMASVMEMTEGQGVDVIFVAAAVPALLSSAVNCAAKGGTVLSFAIFNQDATVSIVANRICMDEVSLIGSYSSTPFEYPIVLELIRSHVVDVDSMVTHRFPLSKLNEAIRTAADPEESCLKVMITPD